MDIAFLTRRSGGDVEQMWRRCGGDVKEMFSAVPRVQLQGEVDMLQIERARVQLFKKLPRKDATYEPLGVPTLAFDLRMQM